MYCINCGKELDERDVVCSSCEHPATGERFVEYPRVRPEERKMSPKSLQSWANFFLYSFGFAMFMGIVFILFAMSGMTLRIANNSDWTVSARVAMLLTFLLADLVFFRIWTGRGGPEK